MAMLNWDSIWKTAEMTDPLQMYFSFQWLHLSQWSQTTFVNFEPLSFGSVTTTVGETLSAQSWAP